VCSVHALDNSAVVASREKAMRRFMGGGFFHRLGTRGGVEIDTIAATRAMVRDRSTADVRTEAPRDNLEIVPLLESRSG